MKAKLKHTQSSILSFNEAMSGGDVRGARQLVRDYYEVGQISRADLEQYLRLVN